MTKPQNSKQALLAKIDAALEAIKPLSHEGYRTVATRELTEIRTRSGIEQFSEAFGVLDRLIGKLIPRTEKAEGKEADEIRSFNNDHLGPIIGDLTELGGPKKDRLSETPDKHQGYVKKEERPKNPTAKQLASDTVDLLNELAKTDFEDSEKVEIGDALITVGQKLNSGYNSETVQEALKTVDATLKKIEKRLSSEHKEASSFVKTEVAHHLSAIMAETDHNDTFVPRGNSPIEAKPSNVADNALESYSKFSTFKDQFDALKADINTFDEQSRQL